MSENVGHRTRRLIDALPRFVSVPLALAALGGAYLLMFLICALLIGGAVFLAWWADTWPIGWRVGLAAGAVLVMLLIAVFSQLSEMTRRITLLEARIEGLIHEHQLQVMLLDAKLEAIVDTADADDDDHAS